MNIFYHYVLGKSSIRFTEKHILKIIVHLFDTLKSQMNQSRTAYCSRTKNVYGSTVHLSTKLNQVLQSDQNRPQNYLVRALLSTILTWLFGQSMIKILTQNKLPLIVNC